MIVVGIGSEPKQRIPALVLEHSIRSRTSAEINIVHSWTKSEGWHPLMREHPRISGTQFSNWRWLVPFIDTINPSEDRCIYLDADQAVLGDIGELAEYLQEGQAISCVHGPRGTFDDKKLSRAAVETSVMVMDPLLCRELYKPKILFDRVRRGEDIVNPRSADISDDSRYRNRAYTEMQFARWLEPELIGSLPADWNVFNDADENTKLVHWSCVRMQPWNPWSPVSSNKNHPRHKLFRECLWEAIHAGFISVDLLESEVSKRHVHGSFL